MPGVVGKPAASASLGVDEDHLDEVVQNFSRMKRVLQTKHAIDAVSFLASDESEFVTGIKFDYQRRFRCPVVIDVDHLIAVKASFIYFLIINNKLQMCARLLCFINY